MIKYLYKARDQQGKLVEGIKEAPSQREVINALHTKGLVPVSIKEVKEKVAEKRKSKVKKKKKKRKIAIRSRIKNSDVTVFCRQMSTMVNSGVSIVEAVEELTIASSSRKLQKILEKVVHDLRSGNSFSEALAKYPRVFSRLFVSMVSSGEESGNLAQVLGDLADYLENKQKLKRQVRSASMYPVFVACFFLLVVAGLVFWLIPRFKELYSSLGAELPLMTKVVVGISDFAIKNLPFFVLFGISVIIAFTMIYKTKPGRFVIDKYKLKIPIFGKIISKVTLARFFQTLATLLKSGVDIISSLDIASKVTNNVPVEKIIKNMRMKIMDGSSLASEMENHQFFPRMSVRMTSVGEKSGKVDEMLVKVAQYYTEEVDATMAGFASIIEPVMIIILGGFVGVFVIAMYLPIFRMAMAVSGGM
ncbi:MAG: type II secretion system F family protein [Elusimicrobiota bacterium]